MKSAGRKLAVVLLLALVLSDAGLGVHTAMHTGDSGGCELCGSWHDLTAVSAMPASHSVPVPRRSSPSTTTLAVPAERHRLATRQRGPPGRD